MSVALKLLPADDHGASVLFSGTTRSVRRAAINAVLAQMAAGDTAQDGPLIVRVDVRPSDTGFVDEVSAAVEKALRALGAPGALYDDRSDAVTRSLGGWLFRARAVGRRGMVLVLDDLSTWLDARGVSNRDVDEPARHLRVLLGETQRRPLSVVAEIHGREASGRPALAEDILAGFNDVHVLGGSPTVTRDPGTIVAALGGRSFSRSSFHEATENWLELPSPAQDHDADDTVIVFTSPLALPLYDWVAPGPAKISSHPPVVAGETHEDPPVDTRADSLRWSDALRDAVQIASAVQRLRACVRLTDAADIERAWREIASPLVLKLESLALHEAAVGRTPTGIEGHAQRALADFAGCFRAVYPRVWEDSTRSRARPTELAELAARMTGLAERMGARSTAVVLLTGLRADLWSSLVERVLSELHGLTAVEEGLHWVRPPGTVTSQRERLAADGILAEGLDEAPPTDWHEALRPRRERLGSIEVLRVWAYATALSAPEVSVGMAARTVEAALPAVLRGVCGGFAGRTAVLLASDVGISRPEDRGEPRSGAITLGGDTAAAVVVPYAVLTWA